MGRRHKAILLGLVPLMGQVLFIGLAGSSFSGAATSTPISLKMTLVDTESPGSFWTGDILRITAQAFISGAAARTGEIDLTTNDRDEKTLCGLIVGPGRGDYCIIDFSNAGRWTIKASYERQDYWPPRFAATKGLTVTIHSTTTTTTERTVYDQATAVGAISSSFNVEQCTGDGVAQYTPHEQASVNVVGSVLSPGAGTVVFTDALGRYICTGQVTWPIGSTGCIGTTSTSAPRNPVTATYSGTQSGNDDGLGTSYGGSTSSAYIETIP